MAKNDSYTVFIVDDDTKTLTMAKHYLEKNSDYKVHVHTFATGEDALQKIDMKPHVMILDYYFDTIDNKAGNGLDILKKVRAKSPETDVIMLSGQDKMETALETIREGAYDYVIKNDSAIMRSQVITDKILHSKSRERLLQDYKRGLRITLVIMALFIIVLVAFVVIATIE